MQHEPSSSAPGVDPLPSVIKHCTSEEIQSAVSALELRLAEQIQASNTALLARLERLTGPSVLPNQQHSIPPDATIAIEGGKATHEQPIDMLNDDPELHEPEFVDFAAYGKIIPAGLEQPHRDIDEPRL
jgi:hypothetical protein